MLIIDMCRNPLGDLYNIVLGTTFPEALAFGRPTVYSARSYRIRKHLKRPHTVKFVFKVSIVRQEHRNDEARRAWEAAHHLTDHDRLRYYSGYLDWSDRPISMQGRHPASSYLRILRKQAVSDTGAIQLDKWVIRRLCHTY